MSEYVVNSEPLLQSLIGDLREEWGKHKYLRVRVRTGKDRSLPQNSFTHAWYAQLARELREYDERGWKCYCKLHHAVPILRSEDEDFRKMYDASLRGLSYEQKINVMLYLPVTSLMTKAQLSKYAEAVRDDFLSRNVTLEFPAPREQGRAA